MEVEADGRLHRLDRGDTLYLAREVRHRWRSTNPATRLLVVALSDTAPRP